MVTAARPSRPQPSGPLVLQNGIEVPEAPRDLAATGLDRAFLADLALKAAHAQPHCTTRKVADLLCLPVPLVEGLLEEMAREHLLEVLGQEGPFNRRYSATRNGHERALHARGICGYVGPAPVTLDAYATMIHYQHSRFPEMKFKDVQAALAELVLPPDDLLTAALAVMSQRSLFVYGPPGNGKTSLARLLHGVHETALWIPHAIAVGSDVIQIFDPHTHQQVEVMVEQPWKVDQRWVRVRRPFIVAGGEMTIESLELAHSPARGFYEAPLHIKSNGGTFVIDDLGRQRVAAEALLNRWIIPLEHGFDYFALHSGPKIRVPFQQMLIVATNLDPETVMDPAFMRRMGYRIHLTAPGPARYQEIFRRYAARWKADVSPGLLERLLARYQAEGRELRGCEPRDLIGRVQDICRLCNKPLELTDETLDLAWTSYFGTKRVRL